MMTVRVAVLSGRWGKGEAYFNKPRKKERQSMPSNSTAWRWRLSLCLWRGAAGNCRWRECLKLGCRSQLVVRLR